MYEGLEDEPSEKQDVESLIGKAKSRRTATVGLFPDFDDDCFVLDEDEFEEEFK